MKLGIMGGTFDPIHIGHLVTAEEARYQFELDEVLFIPSARPPHKKGVVISPAEHRLEMVRLSVENDPCLNASDLELRREGYSYTIDTLRELHRIHGQETGLFFITGTDAILEILTWKNPRELFSESIFIAANRPGFSLKDVARALPKYNSLGEPVLDNVRSMEIPALAISSTDIRNRAAGGRPFRYLVTEEVWTYINDNRLYDER